MSKKIIDWDELRAELLSDSEVQASFDAEERMTPELGEPVRVSDTTQQFREWWE